MRIYPPLAKAGTEDP